MIVFRLAHKKHVEDLSGRGAELYGGRWNTKGTAVVYAAESRSLALLEFLVHVRQHDFPTTLAFVTIELPSGASIARITMDDLPVSWRDFPPPDELAELGTVWAEKNTSLALKVPSAILPSEFNILLNPRHAQFKQVRVSKPELYRLDQRLAGVKG